jgi:hypothetical protein
MNWSARGNVLNQYLSNTSIGTTVKVMEKEKNFHIATIKWLIVLIPVLIPDCLSNIYLLEVEIYSDHWMKKSSRVRKVSLFFGGVWEFYSIYYRLV